MNGFFLVLFATVVISALCLLGMAVGMLIRGKSFTSCACSSITFDGEKIECPGCVGDERSTGDQAKQKRCSQAGGLCDDEQSCLERMDCQVKHEPAGCSADELRPVG